MIISDYPGGSSVTTGAYKRERGVREGGCGGERDLKMLGSWL